MRYCMRYDTSLLKVLEIWNDTFEKSKGKLTQSQVEAFLENIETRKLSYYSEDSLRLGMKLAFTQNTSKLKDIYVLVFKADKQLRESAIKKAEERIAQEKAEEEKKQRKEAKESERQRVQAIENEKDANYTQTGYYETNSERVEREQEEQLEKNRKLFKEKKDRVKQKTLDLNKNQLKDIEEAKSIIQVDIENKCTTCRTVDKYSIKIPDNNFVYFVVCSKCEKEIQLNENTIKNKFHEREKLKIKAEKELNKSIQEKQELLVNKFKRENKEVADKIIELKNHINTLNREIQYSEENEEDDINSKIVDKERQLAKTVKDNYLNVEKEIKKSKDVYESNKNKTLNELDKELKSINKDKELEEELLKQQKNDLKKLKDKAFQNQTQVEMAKATIFKNIKIKILKRKNNKLENEISSIKKSIDEISQNLTKFKIKAEEETKEAQEKVKTVLKKYEERHVKNREMLRESHEEERAKLKNKLELDKKFIRNSIKKFNEDLKRANNLEILRCKSEINKIESEFETLIKDNKKLIDYETNDLIKNLTKEEKKYLEDQINGLKPIEELSYEDSLKRLILFRHLNKFGVWYSGKNRSYVYFEKTEEFWNDFTGRVRNRLDSESFFDGTRGIDDWASK